MRIGLLNQIKLQAIDGAGGWPVGAMAPPTHLKKKKKKNDYMVIMKDTTLGIMSTQAMILQKNMEVEGINYPQPISC
jgi:hypothetical protein